MNLQSFTLNSTGMHRKTKILQRGGVVSEAPKT